MAANYDNSAQYYDKLSRVIFGNTLVEAQVYLLRFIPANANIIIAGGGTGWILEEIAKIHASGLRITYVEVSREMTALAQKRNAGKNQITFINNAVQDIIADQQFDVIITPFLFDNFTETTMQTVFKHLHGTLKINGIWLCTDFQLSGKWWQNVLLSAMYIFFRVTCNIEGDTLPNIKEAFLSHGYDSLTHKPFFNNFIISTQYQKIL